MTDTTAPALGALPQSKALAEATGDSLGELFSRDPEGYQQQDLDRIIAELRAQRERLAAAGSEPKPKAASRAAGLVTATPTKAEDMGL